MLKNPNVTTEMVTTLVEVWPKRVQEITRVAKCSYGNQAGDGQIPIHLLLKNLNVKTEMLITHV